MKLNHLNLCVSDPKQTSQFFIDHFGFQRGNTHALDTLAVIHGDDGFVFVLSNFDKKTTPVYPDGFHVGFIQDTKEQVDSMYERLHAAGFATEAPKALHGSWTFYFNAPDNILVEVLCAMGR